MKGLRGLWSRMIPAVAFLVLFVGVVPAQAGSVSGTVTNNTARTGRVFVSLENAFGGNGGFGVSIPNPSADTPFTIRGVPNGTYTLKAFVDGSDIGRLHANDPTWSSPGNITINNDNYTVGPNSTVTFTSATNVPPQAPSGTTPVNIIPGNNGAFIGWDEPKDGNGKTIADSYKVYYSTSSSTPFTSYDGVITVPASDQAFAVLPYPNGTPLNVQVTALVGVTESAPSPVATAVINPPATGVSISGTINISGFVPTGSLYVAAAEQGSEGGPSNVAFVTSSIQAANNFTVSGLAPSKTYVLYVFIDMNGDGKLGTGDVMISEQLAPQVPVGVSDVTGVSVTLTKSNSSSYLNTIHYQDATSFDNYTVEIGVNSMTEVPVNVTVTNGPSTNGFTYPIDLGPSSNNGGRFDTWLNVGTNRPVASPPADTYSLAIEYAAGGVGADAVDLPVTAVLDSFATLNDPVGYKAFPLVSPTYTWTAPTSPPTPYSYSFWVNHPDFWTSNNNVFSNMPSGTTTASPSGLSYVDGQRYDWTVSVRDSFGNQAQKSGWFNSTSGPGVTGFSPANAVAGTVVTIDGFNFDSTPGNNTVSFNGTPTPAFVQSATPTQLKVVVPGGASTGYFQVTVGGNTGNSPTQITILNTIKVSGQVTDFSTSSTLPVVNVFLNSSLFTSSTSTNGIGGYTITGVPAGTNFSVKFTLSGYDAAWTSGNSTTDLTRNIALFPSGMVTGWNGGAGNGAIRGRVIDQTNPNQSSNGVAGATVTAVGYTVLYDGGDGKTPVPGSVTGSNGVFYILNVPDAATVTMTASAPGFSFTPVNGTGHTDAVTAVTFGGAPLISVTGTVTDIATSGLAGVTVEQVGNTSNNVTSVTGGAFTINNLPGGSSFELKLSLDPTYVPTYTGPLTSPVSFPLPAPYILFTPADMVSVFGIVSGKGAVIGRLVNSANPAAAISGATVTATSPAKPGGYVVRYYDSGTGLFSLSASSTDASGMFLVKDVEEAAAVSVNATAGTLVNGNMNVTTHAPAVTEIMVPCYVPTVNWGIVDSPPTLSILPGGTTAPVNGMVYVPSVTDAAAGPAQGLIAELGYGPAGSAPSSPSWVWKPAAYNTGIPWSSGDSFYNYVATLTVPASGPYDYAFRYSYFGGTYLYGDTFSAYNGNLPLPNPGNLTVTPLAPVITSPTGGALLNTDTPTISGTVEANITVTVKDGATPLGSAVADGSGNWSYTTPALSQGAHSFTAIPSAGSVTGPASAVVGVSVDTVAPDTTIISTPANPTDQTTATFTFSGTDATSGVASYECKLSAEADFSPCTSPKSYNSLTGNPPTAYTFQVRAKDVAGNVDLTPASYTWMVNTTVPGVSITSPAAGYTSNNVPTLTYTVTGATLPEIVKVDGNTLAKVSGDTLGPLADGSHTVVVEATNVAGTGSATVTFTVDTVAPTTAIPSGPPGLTGAGVGVTFSFSGTDATAGVASYECQVDGLGYSACTSPKIYTWAQMTGMFAVMDGSHTFQVRAIDRAGNVDASPASYTWSIDGTAPSTPAITSPSNGAFLNTTTVAISGTAEANSYLKLYDGATLVPGTPFVDPSGNWTHSITALTQGSHTITATVTDAAGNASPAATVSITIDSIPPAAPVITSPANNSILRAGNLTLSGTAEPGSTVKLYRSGYAPHFGSPTADGSGNWTHTTGAWVQGPFSYSATATDAAGNTGPASTAVAITLDNVAPVTTITGTPASITSQTSATFTFSAVDAESGVASYACKLSTESVFTACVSGKSYSGLADGYYTFQVQATDVAGNVETPVSYNWTIDITVPTVTGFSMPANSGSLTVPFAGFTATDNIGVTGYMVTETPTAPMPNDPRWGGPFPDATPFTFSGPGTRIAYAWARDGVGNVSASLSRTVIINLPTTTALVSDLNPSTYGQSVTFTATVTPSAATGTVQFKEGATVLGSASLAGGVASFSTSVLTSGSHSITAVYPGDANYATSTSGSVSQVVNKVTPVITWANPVNIPYGTALGATQLNATASVPGSFAYTPVAGTILNVGNTQTLSVTFTPTDGTNYNNATATVQVNVIKVTPTVTVSAASANPSSYRQDAFFTATITPTSATGTIQFMVDGSNDVGSPVILTSGSATSINMNCSSGVFCTGGIIRIPAGSHTVTAVYSGDGNVFGATSAGYTQTVTKATPVITWATPAPITYGTALSATQLNATTSVPGSFSYTPATGTLNVGSQTLSVTFTPFDTTNYTIATATVTLTVNKATPVISWATPTVITYGTALGATQLNATALPAGGTFVYSPASGTVLAAGSQTLSVTYTPADTANYNNVTATVSLTVNKATPLITWANPADIIYGTALGATQLNATTPVPGTFAYTPAAGTILNVGNTQPLSVTFTPTDTANYTTAPATASINVVKVTPAVTVSASSANPSTYGQGVTFTSTVTPATATGTIQFVVDGVNSGTPVTVTGGSATSGSITAMTAGSRTITAVYSGDGNVFGATSAGYSQTVNKATPTISWATPTAIPYGTALSATQLNATALPAGGTFVYSPVSGTLLNAGSQTLSVTYTPVDTANYNNATTTVTLAVNKATLTVSGAMVATKVYDGTTTATVTSLGSLAGVIAADVGSVTLTGPTTGTFADANASAGKPVTITGLGLTGAASGNYVLSSTSTTATATISKATPVITWANPADIMTGTALSSTQLNAITPVAGTLTYTPVSGTVLATGMGQNLKVDFTPTDAVNYNTTSKTVTINVMVYGDINRDGALTIADALLYLQVSLHLKPAPAFMGNVLLAPIVGGVPTPGTRTAVDVRDVSLVLQKIVGLW
jgi:hypothetical protein